jgi:hypothetical protein
VFLYPIDGTAGVQARGRILGILRYVAEPEQGRLRISALEARAAPR